MQSLLSCCAPVGEQPMAIYIWLCGSLRGTRNYSWREVFALRGRSCHMMMAQLLPLLLSLKKFHNIRFTLTHIDFIPRVCGHLLVETKTEGLKYQNSVKSPLHWHKLLMFTLRKCKGIIWHLCFSCQAGSIVLSGTLTPAERHAHSKWYLVIHLKWDAIWGVSKLVTQKTNTPGRDIHYYALATIINPIPLPY